VCGEGCGASSVGGSGGGDGGGGGHDYVYYGGVHHHHHHLLLCRVFILIFLRQSMSLGNTVLQLFCC